MTTPESSGGTKAAGLAGHSGSMSVTRRMVPEPPVWSGTSGSADAAGTFLRRPDEVYRHFLVDRCTGC